MRPYFLFLLCLLALSCKRNDNNTINPNDYKINGVSDITTHQDTTVSIGLSVVQVGSIQEQVKLSVSDVPQNVTASFSSENGTPDFASILTLKIGYTAPAGTHALKVKALAHQE